MNRKSLSPGLRFQIRFLQRQSCSIWNWVTRRSPHDRFGMSGQSIHLFLSPGNSPLWWEDSRNLSMSSDGNLNLRAALQCFCFPKIFLFLQNSQNSRITERVTRILFEDPRPKWDQTRAQTKFNEGWHRYVSSLVSYVHAYCVNVVISHITFMDAIALMYYVNDKNMLYFSFYCVTQCFSLSLITHKLKITDIIVAFSRILRGVIYVGFVYL